MWIVRHSRVRGREGERHAAHAPIPYRAGERGKPAMPVGISSFIRRQLLLRQRSRGGGRGERREREAAYRDKDHSEFDVTERRRRYT